MLMRQVVRRVGRALRSGMAALESRFKDWTRPAKTNQVTATLADLTRCKGELMAENVFLRQQLIVLERQVARPQLRQRDRQVLVVLASRLRTWREALIVVKPDTLIGWHRLGFKLYWRRKSRVRQGRPPLAPEIIVLIEEMVLNNRTWRAERIPGGAAEVGDPGQSGDGQKEYATSTKRGATTPGRTELGDLPGQSRRGDVGV